MAKKRTKAAVTAPPQTYWGTDIPMRVIQDFADRVAERFQPEKIILFGSYAYGTPNADSDVDILVVMPARNKHNQAVRIRREVAAQFSMDLMVRTHQEIVWRLEEGDTFLTQIFSKGKVLYENGDSRVGEQGRGRLPRSKKPRPKLASPT